MKKRRKKLDTMTETLRKTIAESGMSFRGLETATGIKRQSLMKFMRGEQSLRLDIADKLAAYFGLELKQTKNRKRK
jgi:plasmid maintenance system antidote protein VapI